MSEDLTEQVALSYAQQGAGSLPGIFDELKHIFSEGLQKDVNHEEIICSILEVACNFYGANWCGALNADLPLGVWAPVYWYDAETGKMAPTLFYDYESSTEFENWVIASKQEKMIAYATIDDLKQACPNEYEQYIRLQVKSLLGAPYYHGATGFVVVKNPTRNQQISWVLMAAAYIVGHELQDLRKEEAADFRMNPDRSLEENDVRISVFGRLRIQTALGEISDKEIHDKAIAPVLVYLFLNNGHPVRAWDICQKLWQNDSPEEIKRLQTMIYRFRMGYKELFAGDSLISTVEGGYALNQNYHIISDVEEFDSCMNVSHKFADEAQKIRLLTEAIQLYKGEIYPPCSTEQWLVPTVIHYENDFREAFNELMGLLYHKRDFEKMIQTANHALLVASANEQFYFWYIIAMMRVMSYEQAKGQYENARTELEPDGFEKLKQALSKEKICFDE